MRIETEYGFDLSVDTSDFVQRRHMTTETEPEDYLAESFYNRISDVKGDFIDVGANIGFYSLMFCANGSGTAFAFEPLPYNVSRIRKNTALNDIDNIHVFSAGLSDASQELQIY